MSNPPPRGRQLPSNIKASGIKTLVALRKAMGPRVRDMVADVKPQLLTTIDEHFARVEAQPPPRLTQVGCVCASRLSGCGEGQVCTPQVSQFFIQSFLVCQNIKLGLSTHFSCAVFLPPVCLTSLPRGGGCGGHPHGGATPSGAGRRQWRGRGGAAGSSHASRLRRGSSCGNGICTHRVCFGGPLFTG